MTADRAPLRRRGLPRRSRVEPIPLPRNRREVALTVVLALAYFITARLSLALAIPPGYATAVWPAAGIALASVLLAGSRVWPGIWLGAAASNLMVQGSPLLAAYQTDFSVSHS